MPVLGRTALEAMKPYSRKLIQASRLATARFRALPDVIIIGCQKCGTTSLFHYLSQHPQLVPSFRKEVHYFDGGLDPSVDNYAKGEAWYRSNFPLQRQLTAGQKVYEASPLYMFNPLAPQRIHALLPRARLIALIRNPTERAISHYFHTKRRDKEDLPILEAFLREQERLEPVIKSGDYKSEVFMHKSYQSRGLYLGQLQRYLEYFSRDQILILTSEELFESPASCLKKLFDFIAVDADFTVRDVAAKNVAGNKSQVDDEVYRHLESFFAPHNQALNDFVGQNLGW
jgi:hypothetical protein